MRILYYDCFSGISGDMNLGALINLGVPSNYLLKELKKLNIDNEFKLSVNEEEKQGIWGVNLIVENLYDNHHKAHNKDANNNYSVNPCDKHIHHEKIVSITNKETSHHHNHGRSYKDIKNLILNSNLNDNIKSMSIKIFDEVAIAESKVHGKHLDEVHFHEVGAVDSIIDIVGCAICIDYLNVDIIVSSPVEVGYGFLKCAHGILPVPAPATSEILKDVPIMAKNVNFEATTPTGAAILKALCSNFTYEKDFTINNIGYGLGDKKGSKTPNILRVFLGERNSSSLREYVIESNIDDMTAEGFEILMDRLFVKGALDVFYTPIFMKKERPGTKLSVICSDETLKDIKEVIFLNSSTIGIRHYEIVRDKLNRKQEIISCKFGEIPVKVSLYKNKEIQIKPEYDNCKKAANDFGVSLNQIHNEVLLSYMKIKNGEI